jgi:hypothetical protein
VTLDDVEIIIEEDDYEQIRRDPVGWKARNDSEIG